MQINIKPLRNGTCTSVPFDFTIDISDVEPTAKLPVRVSGEARSRAGVIFLSMTVEGERSLVCDRCAKEFERTTSVPFETIVADHLDNEDYYDDIIVCEGDELELSDLAASVFILGFESKNLCREDCKGLCPGCGADLNEQTCSCKNEQIDPRLEILSKLLDD